MARPLGHGPDFEQRYREIVDAAAELFAERGYAATGIADLCTAVQLGRGALYYYIGSKEKVLVEIQNRVLEPLLTSTCRIVALDSSAMVRLRLLSENLLTVILRRRSDIWVYEHDYRHLTGTNRAQVLAQRRRFEDILRTLLEEAMDAGDLTESDSKLAALQFLNLHNHTYQWARASQPWSATELASTYYRTLMLGFGATTATVRRAEIAAATILRGNGELSPP